MDRIRSRRTGQRVLLVEDHPDTIATLLSLFQQNGCRVRTAKCAADAMAISSLEAFDFVVHISFNIGSAVADRSKTSSRLDLSKIISWRVRPTMS